MSRESASPVLLCCETGAARGHVTTLATVGRALRPDYSCTALLHDLTHADVLAPVCTRIEQGRRLAMRPGWSWPSVLNWALWLFNRGYADPVILKERFDWWLAAMDTHRPRLVVADHAPTALLAARARGIATLAVGASYGLPAASMTHLPDLLTPEQAALHKPLSEDPIPPQEVIRDCINATLGPAGLPPLAHLPEVFAADLSMPHGVSAWDPYADARDRPLVLSVDPLPPLARGAGQEVFIYFSTKELAEPAIVRALRRLPFDARLVAPGLPDKIARYLARNRRLTILPAPVPREEIVRRSRLILCAGQAGSLALGVLTGLPVVALPVQYEQLSNAVRAAEHFNSVRLVPKQKRTPEAILDVIADTLRQPALLPAAQLTALKLRSGYQSDALTTYREAVRLMMQERNAAAGPPS